MTPNPIKSAAIYSPDDAPAFRRLDCRRARDCLTIADRAGWPSYSCASCSAFDPLDGEERKEDCGRLARLIAAVPGGPWVELRAEAKVAAAAHQRTVEKAQRAARARRRWMPGDGV